MQGAGQQQVQWRQHVSESGQIYLSNMRTGETKWLWSRHHDPNTRRDYLVNTISGERIWATARNNHLSPHPSTLPLSAASSAPHKSPQVPAPIHRPTPAAQTRLPNSSVMANATQSPSQGLPLRPQQFQHHVPNAVPLTQLHTAAQTSASIPMRVNAPSTSAQSAHPQNTPPFAHAPQSAHAATAHHPNSKPNGIAQKIPVDSHAGSLPTQTQQQPVVPGPKAASTSAQPAPTPVKRQYREIPAPKSLNLSPDEVLMADVASNRRYIYNKRTRSSRWVRDGTAALSQNKPVANGRRPHSREEAIAMLQSAARAQLVRRASLLSKLSQLDSVLKEIQVLTARGTKYDMARLKEIVDAGKNASMEDRKHAADRLLELGEQLTQSMLRVDGIESSGYSVVRQKRKKCVERLLKMSDSVEELRKKLKGSN